MRSRLNAKIAEIGWHYLPLLGCDFKHTIRYKTGLDKSDMRLKGVDTLATNTSIGVMDALFYNR